jgi:Domain of unknown function (DUF4345)
MRRTRFQAALVAHGRGQSASRVRTFARSTTMSKRALQIATGLLAIIPVATGLLGLLGVEDPAYVAVGVPRIVLLDTNLRFFSGVWLGLGLALFCLIPHIERQIVLSRAIWAMIFIGGIGRVLSIWRVGAPPIAFIVFTAIELIGAPLFIWWPSRLSKYELGRFDD